MIPVHKKCGVMQMLTLCNSKLSKSIYNFISESAFLFLKNTLVKILANGEITKAITVQVNKASATAQAKIEAAGGTLTIV